jgi:hypothetical protein
VFCVLTTSCTTQTGERVTLRERIDENWWDGEARGKIGFFPHSFLQALSLPSSSSPPSASSS